ncbi:MAG TPA: hypothetical protein VGC96_12290, partial [Candidatus Elarobacter sp.]
ARGPEIVVADDAPRDVALVRDALAGHGGAHGRLATRKDEALRRETAVVEGAGRTPVIVETERVATSPLTRALVRHAERGAPTTLVLAPAKRHSHAETRALAALRAAGVTVREGGKNEKLALAGDAAWVGSGNATGATGRNAAQLEWGLTTRIPALVRAIRRAVSRDAR